jgi:hypothetical protein
MRTHHPITLLTRAALLGLLGFAITAATTAQAGNQLFEGSWTVKAFGNELTGGTDESEFYSAFGIPQGIQCNPNQPRCPFDSTPTDGSGRFHPLGNYSPPRTPFCAPWTNWQGYGTTARPAKGGTYISTRNRSKIPPLYRNPAFFTSGGEPNTSFCTATSTGATPGGKGLVQAGNPVTGTWTAITTGTQKGGFNFAPAPENHAFGVRTTGQVGEIGVVYPLVYSYTYATLRNDAGEFGPGKGPGSFNLIYMRSAKAVASINVKQGAAKFGGTMKMLGALTAKNCYYRNATCSLGGIDWRYEAVGAPAYTYGGVVTRGYLATSSTFYSFPGTHGGGATYYLNGYRFPWTTGSVTVKATWRGKWRWPHTTVHYAHGYDNRNTTTPSGKGTIQLVTPVRTRWRVPWENSETAGIGILRIKFVPEPQAWLMLVAGASLLGLGARMRRR